MRKLSSRVITGLLCLLCVLALFPAQTFAAGVIDLNRDVRLTIEFRHSKKPVSDVPFDLYFVADVDAYAEFSLAGDFRKYPVSVNGLSADAWKSLAETLAVYADRDQLKPLDSGKTGGQGILRFPNQQAGLKPGLYLVIGRKLVKDGFTYITEPFLVSLPNLQKESDVWSYDVTAVPKHTQTENPPVPSEQTVDRKVLKVWKKDIPQLRPQQVTVQLLKDNIVYDTVILSEANSWRHFWGKLPEYNRDGSKIIWSVVEKELPHYTVLISAEGITFTVTNTYAPDPPSGDAVTRTVLKVWDDQGYENRRPESVQVTLLQNDVAFETRTLSEANGWQYTWDKLPKVDQSGKEISWTIREAAVSGYRSAVRLNGDTFVLTNTLSRQKLPQTGVLWWPVPILAMTGLAFLIMGTASRKNRDHE